MITIKKIAEKFGNRNRLKKYNFFIDFFKPTGSTKILDIGASEKEYRKNANILEKLYPYQESMTVLGVDEYSEFCKRYPKVKTIIYKGAVFPFQDKEFDLCWSNAVIEHVGERMAQIAFLKEIHRVAKQSLITTPNRFFLFEPHTRAFFLHWLPKKYFDKILVRMGKKWAAEDYMHLLSLRQLREILHAAGISNYKIKKNRFMGFVIDFVVTF